MSATSLTFLLFVAVCLALFHACPTARSRRWVLLGANVVFLASFPYLAKSPWSLLPLVAFLGAGYSGLLVVRRWRSRGAAGAAIALLLLAFVWLRRYAFASFLPALPFNYTTIGLSYVLFRMIHLIVDARSGSLTVDRVTPRAFLNYTCNFLCFASGPIQRFQEHAEQERRLGEEPLASEAMLAATARIVRGYAKLLIVSEVLRLGQARAHEALGHAPGAWAPVLVAAALILELLQWYYNFAGLMDVMIGLGRFFGLRLPENFDRPFSSRSFLELWTRWHITLSEWFRDYVFSPLAQTLVRRWSRKGQVTAIGIVCYFVTFLLLGAWHGPTSGWLGVGLAFGLGVSVNKLYETLLRARLGRHRLATLRARPLYATLCRGCTLLYFASAMGMAWLSGPEARLLLAWAPAGTTGTAVRLVWALPALMAMFLAMGLLLGIAEIAGDYLGQTFAGVWRDVARRPALCQAALGLGAFLVFLLLLDQSFTPQFVYMNF
jgi:D-alanyl-lipoteichoic acid acyltransferase DltB (MBOAT superfamily)